MVRSWARRAGALAAATTVAMAMAGCGPTATPAQTLTDSTAWLAKGSPVTATVSLSGSAANIATALGSGSETAPTAAQAGALAAFSLVATSDGRGTATSADDRSDLQVLYSGKAALDTVTVAGDGVYFKVDVATVNGAGAALSPEAGSAQFEAAEKSLAQVGGGLTELIAGSWVHLPATQLGALAGASASPAPTASAGRLARLAEIMKQSTSVTQIAEGHLKVSVTTDKIVSYLASQAPSTLSGQLTQATSGLPATITVDAYVTDDKLTKIVVPLDQKAAATTSDTAAVTIALAPGTAVSAPTSSTDLDLTKLTQLFAGAMAGTSTGTGSTEG